MEGEKSDWEIFKLTKIPMITSYALIFLKNLVSENRVFII